MNDPIQTLDEPERGQIPPIAADSTPHRCKSSGRNRCFRVRGRPARTAYGRRSVKQTFPARHGHEVVNTKLPGDDVELAVRIAQAEFDKHQPDVVVGSSRGGAVAMNIISGEARLVLLCPAWRKWGTARTAKPGMAILHSRADDVVPFADSEELARNSGATLIEVGTDHRLADPEPLMKMLKACVG
jgi:hypothetical protein